MSGTKDQLPFRKAGSFWRGNLHTHSTRSDGEQSPEEVCRRYRESGYDFLAITDHFLDVYEWPMTDTRAFRTKDFTTIIGAEIHTDLDQIEVGERWHILAVGLPLDFPISPPDETGRALAQRALATGAFVAVAHPAWYALTERDLDALGKVDAIEVYNATSIDDNDRHDSWHFADVRHSRGERYHVCATDDYHGRGYRHDFARGWVWVKCEKLDPDELVKALKRGDYYSSTGPEIYDVEIHPGERAYIRCSPAERVFVMGSGRKARASQGMVRTEFEIDLKDFESPYLRITVRDRNGNRAWTNPVWI